MTFHLPDLTVLVPIMLGAVVLSLAVLAAALTGFFARNRAVRVSRREPLLSYYGHLVLGH